MGGVSAILGNGYEIQGQIVLKCGREGYCQYGLTTGILCWLCDVLRE